MCLHAWHKSWRAFQSVLSAKVIPTVLADRGWDRVSSEKRVEAAETVTSTAQSVWVYYLYVCVCILPWKEKTWLNRLMVMFGIRSKSNLDTVVAWFTSYLLFYWACSPSREEIVNNNRIFWHLELYNTLTKLCLCTFSSISIIKEKNSTGRIRSLLHFNVVKMFWCLITSLFLHFSFLQASRS